MRIAYVLAAAITAGLGGQASAQLPRIVMEEMMVPSEPGIELYVRNKRPADMTAFRPERTVLYVHGATYPASTAFDLKLDGLSWMDYIAARGYDVYLLDLRGYGKSTRPKEMDEDAEEQSADRARRDRGQGYRQRRRLHPRTPQPPARQPDRLVVGHDADGDLHHAERRQGRAAGAVRAARGSATTPSLVQAGPGRSGAYRTVTPRPGAGALDDRRAGRQEGGTDPGRLVRCLGGCDLRNRSGRGQGRTRRSSARPTA